MEELIDYDVVTEMSGHQKNRGVDLVEATRDIFARVKNHAQQVAVNGVFKTFETLDQLEMILRDASRGKFSVRIHDEDFAG